MFRYIVLGLLRNRGSQHGYAIMKEYRNRSGLSVSSGNFYRALQQLVENGLVRMVPTPLGGDTRRSLYEITSQGAEVIEAWLARPHGGAAAPHHDELSARAALLEVSDAAAARRGLEQWREELLVLGKVIERSLAGPIGRERAPSSPTRSLILTRQLQHVSVDLEFISRLQAVCEEQPPPVESATVAERAAPARARSGRGRRAAGSAA
ncbi:MAG: PadR family transcriptional regulator [Candidatus Binatia bacterium]